MDLSQYVQRLREDLSSAAAAGGEQTQRTAALLGAGIEPAARLAIMNALSDLAAEVTASLDDRVVEVRLDGRDVQVVVTGGPSPAQDDEPRQQEVPLRGFGDATGDISRITLRLLDELKGKAEQGGSTQGVSLNTFVSQAVAGALTSSRGGGHGRKGPWGQGGPWGGQQESGKD